MSQNDVMHAVEMRSAPKEEEEVPTVEIGDTAEVQVKITEGDKTRIQAFTGTVIAKKHGGLRETITVRRLVDGEGVERVFPIHSPLVAGIKVKRHGVVRRAKLYYLRDRVGKATRLPERVVVKQPEDGEKKKKRRRKRGAKAKAERKARAAAEGPKKKKKGKKKAEAKA